MKKILTTTLLLLFVCGCQKVPGSKYTLGKPLSADTGNNSYYITYETVYEDGTKSYTEVNVSEEVYLQYILELRGLGK